jgi:DNA polymerase III epsilon subunit family exonuclease
LCISQTPVLLTEPRPKRILKEELLAEVYVAVDVETTGLDTSRDELIEVGLCRIANGAVTERFSSLVRPAGAVPLRVKKLTGITDAMLEAAPTWEEIAGAVASFIGDAPVIGHNVAFDAGFLSRYLGKPLPGILLDTCELARTLLPQARGYSLALAAEALGVPYAVQHRALADAEATAVLFDALLARLGELSPQVLSGAAFLLDRGNSSLAGLFKEALRRATKFPGRISSPEAFVEAKPKEPEEAGNERVNPEAVTCTELFGPGGRLTSVLPGYEYRAQQEEMAAAVTGALENGSYLLVEAGTGIGKSLAYLIPLVQKALKSGKRVLISTHTVNLQEQLLQKDIPSVKAALGLDFNAVLVKGRQHYLCLRRWQRQLEEAQHPDGLNAGEAAARFYARVLIWLAATVAGDFGELSLNEPEREAQARIAAAAEGCFGKNCPLSTHCFVNNARRRAEKALVLITNHSLLLTDAFAGGAVLPDYGPLVIDEAHHLEDVATECLTRSLTRREAVNWLSRLRPILARAGPALYQLPNGAAVDKKINTLIEAARNAAAELFSFFNNLFAGAPNSGVNGGLPARRLKEKGSHLVLDTPGRSVYLGLVAEFETLLGTCQGIAEAGGWTETWAREFALWIQEGHEIRGTLTGIIENTDPDRVEWIEGRFWAGELHAVLKCAPVSVAEAVFTSVFSRHHAAVLTSATLTVGGRFDHFMNRVGLHRVPAERLTCQVMGSPFAYEERSSLCVVSDLPLPQEVAAEEYLQSVADALSRLALAAGGRVLVLFTANRMMREVAMRVRPRLETEDVVVLAQGVDGGRTRLLEEFRHTERAALCGTASFWEGVDISGGLLRMVVIVKLPFPPFETPVLAARRVRLLNQGHDDFQTLSLPYAVLRFKQGFGRLIRSHQDEGVVVVLDRRLVNKSYGPTFIKSLPPLPVISLPLTDACAWLRSRLGDLA